MTQAAYTDDIEAAHTEAVRLVTSTATLNAWTADETNGALVDVEAAYADGGLIASWYDAALNLVPFWDYETQQVANFWTSLGAYAEAWGMAGAEDIVAVARSATHTAEDVQTTGPELADEAGEVIGDMADRTNEIIDRATDPRLMAAIAVGAVALLGMMMRGSR